MNVVIMTCLAILWSATLAIFSHWIFDKPPSELRYVVAFFMGFAAFTITGLFLVIGFVGKP
jgi:steroid 5-alpha reductase family enzyme